MARHRSLFVAAALAAAALAVLAVLLAGCTIKPALLPPPPAPAPDGNTFDGGVIDLGPPVPKGSPPVGPAHVSAGWVKDYAALAKKYGKDFLPFVKPGDGVKPLPDGTYAVDLEHLGDKNTMAQMELNGIPP